MEKKLIDGKVDHSIFLPAMRMDSKEIFFLLLCKSKEGKKKKKKKKCKGRCKRSCKRRCNPPKSRSRERNRIWEVKERPQVKE